MKFLSKRERQEYEAYKASGLTPAQVQDLAKGLLPDSEDRAPLPFSDYDRGMELAYDFHPAHEESDDDEF